MANSMMASVARVRRGSIARALACMAVLACSTMAAWPAQAKDVVVFAAASLKNALDEAGAAWERESGRKAVMSYAASNVLARQIEAGAPADLFFSADLDWMDYAAGKGLIRPDTRANLLGNALVLIAPKDANVAVTLQIGRASCRERV